MERRFVFHVKHLLPDAEVAEDHVEDVLDVDPSGDPSEPARGEPELLCHEILLAVRSLLDRALQRLDGFGQRRTMSRPRDDARLPPDDRLFRCLAHAPNELVYPPPLFSHPPY